MPRFETEDVEDQNDTLAVFTNEMFRRIVNNDVKYNSLFDKLLENTSILEEQSNYKEKIQTVLSVEFLLFRLRVLISEEHFKVKSILNNRETPVNWISTFKQRDVHLASLHQRLIDIRFDVEVLQKLIHSYNTLNFK